MLYLILYPDASTDGEVESRLIAGVTLASAPVAILVFGLAIRIRGWPVTEYLALQLPRWREALVGVACLVVFLPLLDAVTLLSGRDLVHPFIIGSYEAARAGGVLWLLAAAFVVAAPLVEEIAFRGFVFRGWATSRLGPAGAILLASAIWTAMHTQYELFFLTQIFVLGLLLGWIRWRSGSTLLTIMLHALVNAGAFAQAALRSLGVI